MPSTNKRIHMNAPLSKTSGAGLVGLLLLFALAVACSVNGDTGRQALESDKKVPQPQETTAHQVDNEQVDPSPDENRLPSQQAITARVETEQATTEVDEVEVAKPGAILVDVTGSKVPLPITMEELLDRVDIIAVGRVGPIDRVAEEDGFDRTGPGLTPHTYFELKIEEVIRDDGAIARGETILLRAIGRTQNWPEDRSVEGIVKVYHDVDPLPVTGQRRLFLLSRTPNGSYMSGGPSGLLIIDGDGVKFATEDSKPVPFATGKTPQEFLIELRAAANAGQ